MQQRSAKREEKWKQSTQTQHTRKDKTPAPDSKQMWMNLFFLSAFERNMPHRRYLLPFHSPYNIYTRWKITNETAIRIGTKAAKFQIYSNQNAREMMKKGMKIISERGKWQKTTALFRALLLVRCISLKSNVDCSNHSGPGFPLIFVCCCWNSISMSHEIIEFFVTMNRCDSCQQQSLDFFSISREITDTNTRGNPSFRQSEHAMISSRMSFHFYDFVKCSLHSSNFYRSLTWISKLFLFHVLYDDATRVHH